MKTEHVSPAPPTAEAPPAAPGLVLNVGRQLAKAALRDEIEEKIELALYRHRLKPTLALAQRLLDEIEALRATEGAAWNAFLALPWEQWLAKHPEWRPQMDLDLQKVSILARDALTVMQLAPAQLRWAVAEADKLRPDTADFQSKQIISEVGRVASGPASIRENLRRAEHALQGIQPLLERHGMGFAPLVADKEKA